MGGGGGEGGRGKWLGEEGVNVGAGMWLQYGCERWLRLPYS